MPWIKYVGPVDLVDVPFWQVAAVPRDTPVEVSDEAAADLLTQETVWVAADPPADPPADAAAPGQEGI
jgi:hypothetical protein